jgi:hypothetical protein
LTPMVLLGSPLLGPRVWVPLAAELVRRGRAVSVAQPSRPVESPADVVRAFLEAVPPGEPPILVPHSNAGLYVAQVAAAVPSRGVVFVDAGLPTPSPSAPTAPDWLRERLAGLADADGLLAPWTQWWPDSDVAALFPDARTRRDLEAEEPRLPLAYFDAEVPTPPGWERLPAAYLAFGDTYADERAEAVRRAWPVSTLPGGHLHMLVDPTGVAAALTGLVDQWGTVAAEPH